MRKLIPSAILVAAALGACKRPAPPTPSSPAAATPAPSQNLVGADAARAAFWSWVSAHAVELATVRTGQEPVFNALGEQLKQVDSRLVAEVGLAPGDNVLVISANDIHEAIPVAEQLVAAAPKIAGWRLQALRPRKGFDANVALDDKTRLSVDDVKFRLVSAPEKAPLDVIFFVGPGSGDPRVTHALFQLLDAVLGERDLDQKLDGIVVQPITAAPPVARPLRELPNAVDHAVLPPKKGGH